MIGTEYRHVHTTRRYRGAMWAAFLVFGAAFLGKQVAAGGSMLRVLAAVVVMGALAVPAIERPKAAVLGLFVLLPVLGEIRHAFLSSAGVAQLDPLLLVTSAVALTVFISLALNKEMDYGGTPLSKIVFFYLLLGLLQVFNPGQGTGGTSTLLVGATGVMINLIPVTFFFIARSIADEEFTTKVTRLIMLVGTLGALYGLKQVFTGFFGFERAFLAKAGYNAATVGNTTRPFSFFNNAAEFSAYSHYAFVFAAAMFLFSPKGKRFGLVAMLAIIGYGGFLTGSRGFTVRCLIAVVLLLIARTHNKAFSFAVVCACVGVIFMLSGSSASPTDTIQAHKAGASQLIDQQMRALLHPFDRTVSTLPIHLEAGTRGITDAARQHPFGLGTGVTTRGGAKFGGTSAATELDIGDAFLEYGVPGGVMFVLILIIGITQASRVRRRMPAPMWAGIWALGFSALGSWVIGGNYSVTPLIWFFIGAADGAYKRLRDPVANDGAPPVEAAA